MSAGVAVREASKENALEQRGTVTVSHQDQVRHCLEQSQSRLRGSRVAVVGCRTAFGKVTVPSSGSPHPPSLASSPRLRSPAGTTLEMTPHEGCSSAFSTPALPSLYTHPGSLSLSVMKVCEPYEGRATSFGPVQVLASAPRCLPPSPAAGPVQASPHPGLSLPRAWEAFPESPVQWLLARSQGFAAITTV